MAKTQEAPTEPLKMDYPLVWFSILTDAQDQGDFLQAAEAQINLERHGYYIKYRKPGVCRRGTSRAGAGRKAVADVR